jgi:hypothetical protein
MNNNSIATNDKLPASLQLRPVLSRFTLRLFVVVLFFFLLLFGIGVVYVVSSEYDVTEHILGALGILVFGTNVIMTIKRLAVDMHARFVNSILPMVQTLYLQRQKNQ